MSEPLTGTESKILKAAKREFILNGLKGTSMQQIADAANINKSLLHYYFRSKEKLFNAVFSIALKQFVPQLNDIVRSDESLFVKIKMIVDKYIDMLTENPFLPLFILHEINRNPQQSFDIFLQSGLKPRLLIDHLITERDKPFIRPTNPVHLIVNIIALCVFPVAAKTLLEKVFFDNNNELLQHFMQERKAEITNSIIYSIKL